MAIRENLRTIGGRHADELGPRRQRIPAYATGADVEWYRDLGFGAHKASHKRQGAAAADALARIRARFARFRSESFCTGLANNSKNENPESDG